jgi:hypothetical protein
MIHTIRRIDPWQMAKVPGVLYAALGLLFVPFFLAMPLVGADAAGLGVAMAIFMPIFYGLLGAIAGIIGSVIYNLVAGWVGGIRIELGSVSEYE